MELWPSQREAAQRSTDVTDDLVVALPTGAGKTRVAEIAALMTLSSARRVLIVTPLRALSAQTERSFRKIFAPLGFSDRLKVSITQDFVSPQQAVQAGRIRMMFVAHITNNPLVFARNPEWKAVFDIDPERARITRHQLLSRAAADRRRLAFFHAPFPANGYVTTSGTGYEYLPVLWTSD